MVAVLSPGGSVMVARWSRAPAVRSASCHSAVSSVGRSAKGVGATTTPRMRLLRLFASRNSARHHFDAAQPGEISRIASSQRSAAPLSAPCQRSPALSPRSGSRSRKTSFQPSAVNHSCRAIASPASALEWLKKMRATAMLARFIAAVQHLVESGLAAISVRHLPPQIGAFHVPAGDNSQPKQILLRR
jgi:hypothetical protein